MADRTKECRVRLWVFRVIDWIILFAPFIIYFFVAMFNKDITSVRKVALSGMIVIALIITLFNIIAQKHLRSPRWIILLGLYIAGEYIMPLIIIAAVGSVLDEFVLSPLITYYKTALVSNKEIDKRETLSIKEKMARVRQAKEKKE